MVNAKRQLSSDEEEEIIASSSQVQASGSAAKRTKLTNGRSNNGHTGDSGNGTSSPSVEPTRVRPQDSDSEEDDVDELATPAPSAAASRANSRKNSSNAHAGKRNGKNADTTMRTVGEDDDVDGEVQNDAENDEYEEDSDEDERIRNAAHGTVFEKGSVAESGVIDTVVLKDFMCHRHLEVKLGPQINFITGHNGSGKSVILTGITFAFGAKANVTARGPNTKGFVREGASSAEVTITLRNKGPEAYKPDVYGKAIYITRKINAEGGGGYKLADWNKKTVSTQRAELASLCDHFQIQVDNPVNILHQEMAKMFLHSSKPQDKYMFFLKGTQLAQLHDEYAEILLQIDTIKRIVQQKKDRLDDLKTTMNEAKGKWKEIEENRNVEINIKKLKNELAWTHVVEIEEQVQKVVKKVKEEEYKVGKIEKQIKDARDELDAAVAKFAEAQATIEDDEATERLNAELKELTDKIKGMTTEMLEVKSEQRDMQETAQTLRNQIAQYDRELQEVQSRAEGPLRQKMEQSRVRLQQVEGGLEESRGILAQKRAQALEAAQQQQQAREPFENIRSEQAAAQRDITQADDFLRSLQASQENSLNAFGPSAAKIVDAIDRERGWRQKPIGPIGRYIKIRDQKWARTAESVCGDRLNSFLVTTSEDRDRLNRLIRQFRGARHNVLMYQYDDRFFAEMEKDRLDPNRFLTMLDILTFEDESVRQLFIAQSSPHLVILVAKREEGDDIMRHKNQNPHTARIMTCYTMDQYQLGGIEGGSRMTAINQYRGAPRLSKDVEAGRRQALEAKEAAEGRLRMANAERARLEATLAHWSTNKKAAEHDAATASSRIRRLEAEREKLIEDGKEYQPPNVQAIESEKLKAQEEIDNIQAQGHASTAHLSGLQANCKPHVERKEDIKRMLIQRDAIRQSQMQVLELHTATKTEKEFALGQWRKKSDKHKHELERVEAELTSWGDRMQVAMDRAAEICPREEVDTSKARSIKKLEHNINALEKALREKEARLGGSSEEVYKRYIQAKHNYDENVAGIKDLQSCVERLLTAYELRMDRWSNFRLHIATHARMLFIRYLSHRGYSGDLRFSHNNHKLELRVQPHDNGEMDKKSQRVKDSSTLSGGEKSFSTICLLLALWHAAGCPIRGLDEYDVFMDAVNRKVATRMLIKAGQAANNTQMILISPTSIQGHTSTPGVRIIRIADPERGQGTLATNTTG